MKKHKRNTSHRALLKGYQYGYNSKSKSNCPHTSESSNAIEWLRGWRIGREDLWSGFNQQASNQHAINL